VDDRALIPTGSIAQCPPYGAMVADRFRELPNIVWMSGGDYFPATDDLARGSDVDHCIDAMMRGVRAAGTPARSRSSSGTTGRSPRRTPTGHRRSRGREQPTRHPADDERNL
jgi:hypothetical protein